MTTVKVFRDNTRSPAILPYHIADGVHYMITVRWRSSRAECVSIHRLVLNESLGEPSLKWTTKRTVLGRRLAREARKTGTKKFERLLWGKRSSR